MGMTVQHNMTAMNANRQLGISNSNLAKSTEKLSSGYKINRAGDNAAGLAISEKMRGQIRGLDQASSNAEDGISLIQTAEGNLQESQNIIQRMRELAVQASSDTNTNDDRTQIQQEIQQLTEEVDRIANTTEFNTKKLLDGSCAGSSSYKAGQSSVEGTFANGVVNVNQVDTSTAALIGKDDIIRIEFTKDSELGGVTGTDATANGAVATSLHGTQVTVADMDTSAGSITIGGIAFSDIDAAKAAENYDDASQDVTFTINNAKNIKAGDVITINLQKCDLNKAKNTGEDALRLQVGANGGQEVQVQIKSMKAKDLGITQTSKAIVDGKSTAGTIGSALDVTSQAGASLAIEAYDNALQNVSTERAKMGAMQNRLEHTINNLDTSAENLQSAESNIRDTDMADEMTKYSKNNILMQAGQSMLAQANQSNQGVLSLLQ
jgi:flagellin